MSDKDGNVVDCNTSFEDVKNGKLAFGQSNRLGQSPKNFPREDIEQDIDLDDGDITKILESGLSVGAICNYINGSTGNISTHSSHTSTLSCSRCGHASESGQSTGSNNGGNIRSSSRELTPEMLHSTRSSLRSQHLGQPTSGQQHTRTPSWSPCWGNIGIGEPSRLELGVAHPGTSAGPRILILADPAMLIQSTSQSTNSGMSEQRDQSVANSNPQFGGILPPALRTVQPLWGKLLPMHEQLYSPPNNGILSTLQQGNGSLPLPLQGVVSGSLSQNDELPKSGSQVRSPKKLLSRSSILSDRKTTNVLPSHLNTLGGVEEHRIYEEIWKILVCNLIGDQKYVIGSPNHPVAELCGAVKIVPTPLLIPERSGDLINPFRNVFVIYEGKAFPPVGTWKEIGLKNNCKVHVMRRYDPEERQFLYERDKKERKTKFEERCKSVQTNSPIQTNSSDDSKQNIEPQPQPQPQPQPETTYQQFLNMRIELKLVFGLFVVHLFIKLIEVLPFSGV